MSFPSYKPFLIAEFKTGLFNYLEPWIRPNDAFDPLDNAYVYRGSIFKRNGSTLYGLMAYCDEGVSIGTGNGTKNYSGTLSLVPIRPGSFTVITRNTTTAAILESFTDNGAGVLTGSAGGSGTINYTTGAWTLAFHSNLTMGVVIYAGFTYNPTLLTTSPVFAPIMAIKQYQDDTNNSRLLVACDTKRAAVYNNSTNRFDPICNVSEQIGAGDGTMGPFTFTAGFGNIAHDSFFLDGVTETFQDTGTGNLVGSAGGTGTINYSTGSFTVTFNANNSQIWQLSYSLNGNYFTGDETNFFNSTNWQPTADETAYLYLTNDFDPITLFDGTNLARPPFAITQAHADSYTNDIQYALDVNVYKQRLLIVRPKVVGMTTASGQSIRWSAPFLPFNFVADVAGNGGELSAPTASWIFTDNFLRDVLVCGFQRGSTWIFRYTGNDNEPFRWDKLNESKSIDAPYAGVQYDERVTNAGSNGLLACDGVNVSRYDLPIIDQFLDINQDTFYQCFAQRFDTLNQTWMCYPSQANNTNASDKILIYNFIENTWSTYDMPMSCLGLYFATFDAIFNDFQPGGMYYDAYPTFADADIPWDYFAFQDFAPVLLGGTHDGAVVLLNIGNLDNVAIPYDTPSDIDASITSTRWNPFVGIGEKVQFGYIDFYYEINPNCVLTLSFFVNNSSAPAATRTLTLDGSTNDDFAWKRIYLNIVGEFLQVNIESSVSENFKISGMVLWAKPSGRLTQGLTV